MEYADIRVQIAQDVLELLSRPNLLVPKFGNTYMKMLPQGECAVCALGAMFAASLLNEGLRLRDCNMFFGLSLRLEGYFTSETLRGIEREFERPIYFTPYKNAGKRIAALMNHLIRNKGEFIPGSEPNFFASLPEEERAHWGAS